MRKLVYILALVGMVSFFGCSEGEDITIDSSELPVDDQLTDGDDDDASGGPGGGSPGNS